MSQCRQSQLFCHATASTVSSFYSVIITRYHHSIPSQGRPPNSPKEHRPKEHRSDKETVLTLIPWCHEIIPTIPSYWSRIILVKNHACPESYWSRIILVKNHACPESFREGYHSDNDLILTRCDWGMKTGGLNKNHSQDMISPRCQPFQRANRSNVPTVPKYGGLNIHGNHPWCHRGIFTHGMFHTLAVCRNGPLFTLEV